MPDDILYSIRDLTVEYTTRAGSVKAVDNVSLDIRRGEILGLVGESGCGKSTLGKALMRLHTGPARITAGELWFDGRDLMTLSDREMPEIRGAEIGMVFQDPMTSLNPVQRILEHLTETIQTHEPEVSDADARKRAEELIERLGIRRERITEYPHQMSGGMRQRVMISLALALQAEAGDCRRANHLAGCDRGGQIPGPAQGAAKGIRPDHPAYHAQYRRGG